MDYQVTLYSDGQLAEFYGDQLIRLIPTRGNIADLIEALHFSRATQFTLSSEPSPSPDGLIQARGGQRINETGLHLLTRFEGCELTAYDDGVGVWTIGYGHTAGVSPGMTITQAQAEEFLRQDLEQFEAYVRDSVEVELNGDQFSALVCFCFNIGPAAFRDSTLRRLLNQGEFEAASQQFPRWNKGDGKPMLGLTRRRLAEQALFRSQPWEFALTYDGPLDIPVAQTSASKQNIASRSLKLTTPRMEGEDVRQLQLGLQKAGFDLKPDGIFGPATEAILRQWQEREGWTVDGVVGPSLFAALT